MLLSRVRAGVVPGLLFLALLATGCTGSGSGSATPSAAPTWTMAQLEGPLRWPSLFEGLVRMSQDPKLALTQEQAQKMLGALHSFDVAMKPFSDFEGTALVVLTPQQMTWAEDNKPDDIFARTLPASSSKTPLLDALEATLRARAAQKAGMLEELSPMAYITPSASPTTQVSAHELRAGEMLWGILQLDQAKDLALSADQASKLLPWVEPMKAGWEPLQQAVEGIEGLLAPPQKAFLESPAASPVGDLQVPQASQGKDPLFEEVRRIVRTRAQGK